MRGTLLSAVVVIALAAAPAIPAAAADPKPAMPGDAHSDVGNFGNTPYVTPDQPPVNPEHKKAMRELEDRQIKEVRALEDKQEEERMALRKKHAGERETLKHSFK